MSKIIELKKYTVELIDELTWGQQEKIRATIYGGVKMAQNKEVQLNGEFITKAKYAAIEVCVKKITDKETNEEVKYTTKWLDGLSVQDGDDLYMAVNELTEGKKNNS